MIEVTNGKIEMAPEPASEAVSEAVSEPVIDEVTPISAGAALRALASAPLRWMRTRGRPVVVGVVIAALGVALITTDLKLRHQEAIGSARSSALTAADTYSVELASYDYRHLDQDFGAVRDHSSPAFQASFTQSSSALESVLVKYHATATATVVSSGVVSAGTAHAVVLVFLEQTVVNSTQRSGSQKAQSRVEMSLVRSHGHWLIDQVKLL
jgi:Mce-associated membrane protein